MIFVRKTGSNAAGHFLGKDPIELHYETPAIGFVLSVSQQVAIFLDPTHFPLDEQLNRLRHYYLE